MKVLITDGSNRSALAAVRSLGRRGHDIFVVGSSPRTLASCSRFCRAAVEVPDPHWRGEDYVDEINAFVKKEGIDVILPMTDQTIQLLSAARSLFPAGIVVACPDHDKIQAVSDKYRLFELARDLDVPIPKTIFLRGADGLRDVIDQIESYPVVVKPAFSRKKEGQSFLAASVSYADSREQLESLYATERALRYPSLIQEKIEGPGTGLFTLFDRDRHLTLFSHQRLREKPPSGGASVVCRSVPLDEEMVEAARRLLSAVEWQGVAMVEFKRDLRDGKAKLMEINGRFWGSLQLAVTCGVDFPGLLVDFLNGKLIDNQPGDYRCGVRMKWLFGTLDHLLIRLRNSREQLHLPAAAPSKAGAVMDFLKIWEQDSSFDVFDPRDLGPFRFEAACWLRHAVGRKPKIETVPCLDRNR